MAGADFDEDRFFSAIQASGARALLIGRRALIILGVPVLTADYDLWLHFDDVEKLNVALAALDLAPNRTPAQARQSGRYVLENDEHVDVMIARSIPTVDGIVVAFDEVWARRQTIAYVPGVDLALPSLDDLILTKRFGARRHDLIDIQYLEGLKAERAKTP